MGAGLARLEAGAGGRPLLLAHGFTSSSVDYAEHLDGFAAAGWHAVAPDLPGHGDSHMAAGFTFTFDSMAETLVDLADELGWDRFALLGHSMGGVVAQHLAFAHPDRLAALILMDTSPEHFAVDLGIVELACEIVTTEGISKLLEVQKALGSPLETAAAKRLREERSGWVEQQDAKLLQVAPDMYVAMARALATAPTRVDRLATITAPTLVLVGELDALLLEPSHRLAAAIPGAELVVLPDAGHSPQVETPDAWFDEVTRFLSR